jgi:LCP family protein required for cell wall assembly
MSYFSPVDNGQIKEKFYKRRWVKVVGVILAILLVVGGVLAWKADSVLKKISSGGLLDSLVHSLPGVKNELKGEKEGRINVLLLGMRGAELTGGGLLTDTIIVASIKPAENKVSMISIPRDLYVTVPGTQDKQKINAVHAYGEQKGAGQGMADMKTVVEEVTGLPIHYAVSTSFAGFTQMVDAIGGVDITLEKPFDENLQFNEEKPCDSTVFTVPTGKYEQKTKNVYWPGTRTIKRVRVTASYPLCTNPVTECGGNFSLPAGKQTLDGTKALCYARSRKTSSDFERAKRQQIILQLVKDKLLSAGTMTDFSKINGILNSLGDNVRTDMQSWEMKALYDMYAGMQNPQVYQRVLENSEEGLLYNPPEGTAGYILLPIGDNYNKIHDVAANIFTLPAQSDIKPKN